MKKVTRSMHVYALAPKAYVMLVPPTYATTLCGASRKQLRLDFIGLSGNVIYTREAGPSRGKVLIPADTTAIKVTNVAKRKVSQRFVFELSL
jgi:hypothetical protein